MFFVFIGVRTSGAGLRLAKNSATGLLGRLISVAVTSPVLVTASSGPGLTGLLVLRYKLIITNPHNTREKFCCDMVTGYSIINSNRSTDICSRTTFNDYVEIHFNVQWISCYNFLSNKSVKEENTIVSQVPSYNAKANSLRLLITPHLLHPD